MRFELVPLSALGRPRIDVLANLSGIFRDSFANVVELLDDLFRRAAQADEPPEQNYVRKHALELEVGCSRQADVSGDDAAIVVAAIGECLRWKGWTDAPRKGVYVFPVERFGA